MPHPSFVQIAGPIHVKVDDNIPSWVHDIITALGGALAASVVGVIFAKVKKRSEDMAVERKYLNMLFIELYWLSQDLNNWNNQSILDVDQWYYRYNELPTWTTMRPSMNLYQSGKGADDEIDFAKRIDKLQSIAKKANLMMETIVRAESNSQLEFARETLNHFNSMFALRSSWQDEITLSQKYIRKVLGTE